VRGTGCVDGGEVGCLGGPGLVVCGCGVCTYGCVLAKLRVSKVAVCCFSWGICYDFYAVKTAAGG
jgi:hypothetical protein